MWLTEIKTLLREVYSSVHPLTSLTILRSSKMNRYLSYFVFPNVYFFLVIVVKNDIHLQLMQPMKTYLATSKGAHMRSGCLAVEKAWDPRLVQSAVRKDPDSRQPLARRGQIHPCFGRHDVTTKMSFRFMTCGRDNTR